MSHDKPKRRRRPAKAGPYSRDLSLATLDRRTRAGKIAEQIHSDLTADLGGEAELSTQERLLVEAVTVKAVRIALLGDRLLSGEEPGEDGHHLLAWANSMRLDLASLGLKRRARDLGVAGSPPRSTIRDRARAVVVSEYEAAPA